MDKATKISKNTKEQIKKASEGLLDLTNKNSLLNFNIERSSSQIRIVNGSINAIYGILTEGKGIDLAALPELPEKYEDECEKTPDDLRKQWAEDNGINPSYENALDGNSEIQKHQKYIAQTMLYPDEFTRKIAKIMQVIRSDKEEKGVPTFYIAFGFLEWYEQKNSDKKHFAPLLLLKLEDLKNKGKGTGTEKIGIFSAGEAIVTNLSLREKLKREFDLDLPEYQEDDDPVSYIHNVEKLISVCPKWKVRNYITVGRFVFSRLVMYEDLKEENWQTLLEGGSKLLKTLFEGRVNKGSTNIIYDIDKDAEVDKYAPILITSADSSQHSAIVGVMRGDNVVIKGPPGTGKSQTITNLIANALYKGKKVLFMAEKEAALNVVFSRLKHAGLGDYCFKLHSDKTKLSYLTGTKEEDKENSILKSSLKRYDLVKNSEKKQIDNNAKNTEKEKIREYYDLLQSEVGQSGKTLFELVWNIKKHEPNISKYPSSLRTDKKNLLGDVFKIKHEDWVTDKAQLSELENLYKNYQSSIQNLDESWKKISSCSIKMKDIHEYLEQIDVVRENINDCIDRKDEYINKSLAVDDTINGSNALLAELQDCSDYIKQNGIEAEWVQVLTNNEYCKKIAGFTKMLRQYKECEENLSDIYASPTAAMEKKDAYSAIYESLKYPELEDKTLQQLLDMKENVKKEIDCWNQNINLVKVAKKIYGKDDVSVNEICCIKELIGDFRQVGQILPRYAQSSTLFSFFNRDVLDKIIDAVRNLDTYKNRISNFNIEEILKFQDIEQRLEKLREKLKKTGMFRFFDINYWSSMKFYKKLAHTGKIIRDVAIRDCNGLSDYVEAYKQLNNNDNFKNVLGEHFQGIETKIQDLQIIRRFCEYGGQSVQGLIRFFNSNDYNTFQEVENLLKSCKKFEMPEHNIKLFKDYFECLQKIDEMELSEDFLKLFADQNITITEITNSYDDLLQLQKLSDKLSKDNNAVRKIIPSLADSNEDQLDSLLEFKQEVKQCKHIKETDVFLMRVSQGLLPETIANTKKYYEQLNALNNQIKSISVLFEIGGERFNNDKYKTSQLDDLLNYFNSLSDNRDAIYNMCAFYDKLGGIKNKRYEGMVNYLREKHYDLDGLADIYDYLVCYNLVKNIKDINWNAYIPNEMSRVADKIKETEDSIYEHNVELLKEKIDSFEVPEGDYRGVHSTNLQLIRYIESKIGVPHLSLRRFIEQAGEAFLALRPCFLMSPIAVAQYIPPYSVEFDLLIIDEASQMYFEEALGGIFRAKQIVVVGDEKQLPPSNFFKNTAKDDDFYEDEEEYEDDNGKSVLDICVERGFTSRELLWHYRSKDSSLITFSNVNFYNEDLKVFPSPVIHSKDIGVKHKYVGGVYRKHQNEKEANAIIREVKIFVREHPDRSLGIATINDKQRQLVEEKLDQLKNDDADFSEYCEKWENGIEKFFIKSLENVQGDERDYIFVSTVYGPDENGKFKQHFGPINKNGGHRRLNVLFTRAKYGLTLFTSMKSDNITVTENSPDGVRILKEYLHYAETGKIDNTQVSERDIDSEFEKMVYEILVSKGYEVDKQVGVKGFFIDLAVKHPLDKSYYAVGIEFDGAQSIKSVRDRDCIRQSVLEGLGWKIYRIWSKDWYYNTEKEIEKLLAYIEEVSKEKPQTVYEENNNYIDEESDDMPEADDEVNKDSASLTPDDKAVSYDITPAKIYHDDDAENEDSSAPEKAPLQNKSVKRKIVEVYDTVTYIRTSDDTEHTVQITPNVSDLEKGLINKNTPLAVELLDGEENDEVEVNGKIILIKKITKGAGINQK